MNPEVTQEILIQEFRAVNTFFHMCDEHGLRIPGDSPEHRTNEGRMQIRAILKSIKQRTTSAIWPPNHWQPVYAIAQHYGIKTRLLDWTRKPRIAAYFAACEAAKSEIPPVRICVWAINITYLAAWQHVIFDEDKSRLTLRFVTPARSENPNLHAQAGLLSLDGDPTRRISIDKLLLNQLNKKASDGMLHGILSTFYHHPDRLIRKLVLPGNCARSVLRLLAHESISAASIYPGYRGVVESLKEREFWD